MRHATAHETSGSRGSPGYRVFVLLAAAALVCHLAQVAHFLSVPHVVGADGELHHVCTAHHAAGEHGEDDAPAPDGPAEPDGDACPLMPPGLEPCAAPVPEHVICAATPSPAPQHVRIVAPGDDDVLELAPKQSPPARSRS